MRTGPATFGRSCVRTLVIAATSVLCGAVVMASGPAALAADSVDPTLTLTPATGPPGTHVTISGRLTAAQIPVWAPMLNTPFYGLVTDLFATCNPASRFRCTPGPANLDHCELVVGTTDETIHLDTSTGVVTGSFVVDGTGICVQSDPDAATHSAPPGEYGLAISCGACQVATFILTKPAATLPFTGFPVATASICASSLVFIGVLLWRRRPLRREAGS
jgi:hypothetical protein